MKNTNAKETSKLVNAEGAINDIFVSFVSEYISSYLVDIVN